jgi:hypothetical protein
VQNPPNKLEIALLELMTLILVILRLSMLRKLTPKYSENSEKYGIDKSLKYSIQDPLIYICYA